MARSRWQYLWTGLCVAAAAVSGWEILSLTLPGALVAAGRPDLAFALRPSSSVASTSLAASRLARGDAASAEALARLSLGRAPYDQRALAVLAAAAEQQHRPAEAIRLYMLAARFGWRDSTVSLRLFEYGLGTHDFQLAAMHGDALARRGREREHVFAGFRAMMGHRDGVAALLDRFRDDPSWRALFFREIGRVTPDERRGTLLLKAGLAGIGRPLSARELAPLGTPFDNVRSSGSATPEQRRNS